jgi:hypothetical protein
MPLEFAPTFVILLRFFVPFLILRWPLLGAILALLVDASDVMIFEKFGFGFIANFLDYHQFDKIFDMWYLTFEFLVIRRWADVLAKKTGTILFGWRFIGSVIFILFGVREILFFAPNIFEYFFLAMLVVWKFNEKFELTKKSLTIILLIVGIPTLIKEYFMHFAYPDILWVWFRDNVFWWLYS